MLEYYPLSRLDIRIEHVDDGGSATFAMLDEGSLGAGGTRGSRTSRKLFVHTTPVPDAWQEALTMSMPDLNLLVTLDFLLTEDFVVRAARQLQLRPSAMGRVRISRAGLEVWHPSTSRLRRCASRNAALLTSAGSVWRSSLPESRT